MSTALRPPGPRGRFLTGNLAEFRADTIGFLKHCASYGDVVGFRLANRRHVLISHPDLIEQVLVTDNRNFRRDYITRLLVPVLGNGLLLSEGDFWLRQRRLVQPAFSRGRIAAYGEVMVDYTKRMLFHWKPGQTLDIHRAMMRLTLEIVAKVLFDADVACEAGEVGEALHETLESFNARMFSAVIWPYWVPTPTNLRLRRAVRRLDRILYGIIRQRRASGADRGDLLSILLRAQDQEGDGLGMTDRQLRDEAMTLFLAGHETTAIALSWTFYLLAQHPEIDARLFAELCTELGELGERTPTLADLPRLKFAGQVVTESMRLYPPAYVIGREAQQDCELGGYPIPRGTTIDISQWVVHRDPRFFDNPEKFDPDRWEGDRAKAIPKYAYFPFGGGPRLCIGNTFAMMEATLILATVAQRYRLPLVPGQTIFPWPAVTLRPKPGIQVTLEPR